MFELINSLQENASIAVATVVIILVIHMHAAILALKIRFFCLVIKK